MYFGLYYIAVLLYWILFLIKNKITTFYRYPAETMKRIAQLAANVTEKYRSSRRDKLKRTFVGASDAAEMKAKRTFKKP